jgi:hypothetical protein
MATPQNFFLVDELSSTASLIQAATFDAGSTTDVSGLYPYKAQIRVEESVFQNMFQYWSDAKDMTDVVAEDILYKLVTPGHALSPDFVVGAIQYETDLNPDNLLTNYLPQNFLRHLALHLFNTTRGVDLFSNEQAVLESIDARCKVALINKLSSLDANGVLDAGSFPIADPAVPVRAAGAIALVHSNPSLLVMKHLLNNDPSRFSDITPYQVGLTNWFKMAIKAGDSVNFPITIQAPTDQQKLVLPASSTPIPDLTILIKCVVVANGTIPVPYIINSSSALSSLADRYA